MENSVKKLVLSTICAASVLFGAGQAQGMLSNLSNLQKVVLVGGAYVGKKYFYDPIRTMIEFKKDLAPQKFQDLSNKALDDLLKTETGSRLHKFSKKLLVIYLKALGYNRVYITNLENVMNRDVPFSKLLYRKNAKLSSSEFEAMKVFALVSSKGGIFLSPITRYMFPSVLNITIKHENTHHYRGDTVKPSDKFPYFFSFLSPKSSDSKRIQEYQNEFETCRRNIKTLFNSGNLREFYDALVLEKLFPMKLLFNTGEPNRSSKKGHKKGFEEIAQKNPNHRLIKQIKKIEKIKKSIKKIYQQTESIRLLDVKIHNTTNGKEKLPQEYIEKRKKLNKELSINKESLNKAKKEAEKILFNINTNSIPIEKKYDI